jgi:hypothetical protein
MLGQTRQYSNRNPTDAPVNLAEEERIVHGKEIFSRNTEDLVIGFFLFFSSKFLLSVFVFRYFSFVCAVPNERHNGCGKRE